MSDRDDLYARAIVTVVSTEGQIALVRSSGATGCGGCSKARGCGTRVLMSVFGEKPSLLRVVNTVNARAGDLIEIEIEHAAILRMSVLSYLLPLVGLVAGGAIGSALSLGDGVALIGSMLGLAAGFVFSQSASRREQMVRRIAPTCVRKLASQGKQNIDVEAMG